MKIKSLSVKIINLYLLLATLIMFQANASAQTVVGGEIPDTSAVLDLQSTDKGVLFPRMSNAQRDSILLPAEGLLIFNTTRKCIQVNIGTPNAPEWRCLAFSSVTADPVFTCGAYIAPGVWKEFMCYNLGAAYTGNDSARLFTPGWEINGGYWQWGQQTPAAAGPSGPGAGQANDGVLGGWIGVSPTGVWVADPCPSGFRLPTATEWDGVISHNTNNFIGSPWTSTPTNYATGLRFGEKLFLPAAGYRNTDFGSLANRGASGGYWSSTPQSSEMAHGLIFNGNNASTTAINKATGFSIRCIEQ